MRQSAVVALALMVTVPAASPSAVLRLSPQTVTQGEAIEVVVRGAPASEMQVRFAGRTWPLYWTGEVHATYVGTDPFTAAGRRALVVEMVSQRLVREVARGTVMVTRGAFARRRLRLDPSKEALFDPKLVAIERRKVGAAFSARTPRRLWEGRFSLPTTARMSSPYGLQSIYNGTLRGWHRGTDFAAPTGSPVRAANHGIVRLAEAIPLSGNAVLLDHGLGVFSTYMHMSSIAVHTGQRVRKGEIVGTVGSTGVATGPHLHWGLRVNGLYIDPMRWSASGPP